MVSEEAALGCLFYGVFKSYDSKRILGTNVNDRLLSSDCIRTDKHTLDKCMRVTLDNGTVHECARVTLVGVTDKVLLSSL